MEGNTAEDKKLSELIAGFDMVNEEDFNAGIDNFAEQIMQGQQSMNINNEQMPCFFHCGETHSRTGSNLHDAIMLGTKRIGHGF